MPIALASLALLPFIPILPGLGSLSALLLVLIQQEAPWHWRRIAVAIVSLGGLTFAALQTLSALFSMMGLALGNNIN
ncbi:MAG: hypothetical protein JW900_01690 [Anaerolineae bacterium]|nr:hypothetical protein [Anaerolineae bacterium]